MSDVDWHGEGRSGGSWRRWPCTWLSCALCGSSRAELKVLQKCRLGQPEAQLEACHLTGPGSRAGGSWLTQWLQGPDPFLHVPGYLCL